MIGRKSQLFLWFVIICGFVKKTEAFNILGVVTSLSRSHSIYASSIFNELAHNGHSVTVLSPFPQIQKIKHFSLEDLIPRRREQFYNHWKNNHHQITEILNFYKSRIEQTSRVIDHVNFQKLLKVRMSIDIIIFDYDYNDALLGLGEYFNCPIIILTTGKSKPLLNRLIGIPYPLSNINQIQYDQNEYVFEFIEKYFINIVDRLIMDFYFLRRQKQLYSDAFNRINQMEYDDLIQKYVKKIFSSSINFDKQLLVSTDIVDVTGVHIFDKNELEYNFNDHLDQFIHSADNGCIYISFGPDIDPSDLPKDKINTIFRVLYRRPEKIIWAWNGNISEFGKTKDFYIDKWINQDDILRHNNIKLFITNGGHLSLLEALYHEIPIIGIPFTQEQSFELDLFVQNEIGIKIDFNNITIESISYAINEILDNERYRKNLIFKSSQLQNRPIPPIKMIKHLLRTMYEDRHEHIELDKRKKLRKFMLIEFHLLDVYAILLFILLISFLSIVMIMNCFCRLISYKFSRKKLKLY